MLTLGQLRELDNQVKQQLQAKLITIDITQNAIFKEAFAEGKESGFQESSERTMRQATIALLQLGKLSIMDIAESLEVDKAYLIKIKQSLNLK